jgi:hypothetical protein
VKINNLFLAAAKEREREFFDKAYNLSRYFVLNRATLESIKLVLDLERKLIAEKGPLLSMSSRRCRESTIGEKKTRDGIRLFLGAFSLPRYTADRWARRS